MAFNPAVSLHLPYLETVVLLDYLSLQKAVELFDDSTTENLSYTSLFRHESSPRTKPLVQTSRTPILSYLEVSYVDTLSTIDTRLEVYSVVSTFGAVSLE